MPYPLSPRLFATILALSATTPLALAAYADEISGSHVSQDQAHWDLAQLDSPALDATADMDRISIPGSSVSLLPPAGFVVSDQFSGLVNQESLASIVLAELPPDAYTELSSILSSTPEAVTDAFAARGIVLEVETISSVLVEGSQVPFVKGTQTVGGTQIDKYFALFGTESTILLTFNVTDPALLSEQAVVETIKSVEVAPALSIEQKVAELPFTFVPAPPFQVFEVLLGSTVLLSPGGEPDPSGEAPVIIIASSVSPILGAELAAFDIDTFSSQLLLSTEGFAEATITARSPTEFAGGEGYLIQASISDSTVFQYLRILPDNFYIRLLAVGSTDEIEDLAPTIEAIQSSVVARP
ncbi:hypothetical protein S7335_2612 [Synechococcus sp. PCC 7335]|uniref:hypothetical protein n=1 Tax=Synechococcus sp. (strain ATCC 29403 / PCC 7335) TaxID=91464 RepID=UPI00017EC3EF|nr:hypothetical protein [Synechococcus sp. PCC 7335]EDX84913.1 hypothetical protein S7335_2612 [Synechococcus sp. PCC 7335]